MTLKKCLLAVLLAPLLCTPLRAEEGLVTFKSMSVDLALALAHAALADCQKQGYQVTVAVVDRFGVTQILLRDRFAGPHTVPTATGKAWTAVSFRTNTGDLEAIAAWLKDCGVTTVAMESTGVYWIPLYDLLASQGFDVLLVDPRQTKHAPGRPKTDVVDCQWIRRLHGNRRAKGTHPPV